eukprot:5654811-Prymnesium_polylepis.2
MPPTAMASVVAAGVPRQPEWHPPLDGELARLLAEATTRVVGSGMAAEWRCHGAWTCGKLRTRARPMPPTAMASVVAAGVPRRPEWHPPLDGELARRGALSRPR